MKYFVAFFACVAVVVAHGDYGLDNYAPANYKYEYSVADPHTGDNKQQYEIREGDFVKGAYSLVEPDGTIRVVEYTSHPHTGFNAVVKKLGHAVHPQQYPTYPVYPVHPVSPYPYHGAYGYGAYGYNEYGYKK